MVTVFSFGGCKLSELHITLQAEDTQYRGQSWVNTQRHLDIVSSVNPYAEPQVLFSLENELFSSEEFYTTVKHEKIIWLPNICLKKRKVAVPGFCIIILLGPTKQLLSIEN